MSEYKAEDFIRFIESERKDKISPNALDLIAKRFRELERELELTDHLYNEHKKVLDAIPECEVHGSCIPHAIDWINENEKSK